MKVNFCPVEELIWSKSFVMERERYDGADIAHIIRARGGRLDWPRLLRRFETHWHVLLSHLILFDFIYPAERSVIPGWLIRDLLQRLEAEQARPLSRNHVCRGTLLSRSQYRTDVEDLGYQDAPTPVWIHDRGRNGAVECSNGWLNVAKDNQCVIKQC